jgi:hypothetical protein
MAGDFVPTPGSPASMRGFLQVEVVAFGRV